MVRQAGSGEARHKVAGALWWLCLLIWLISAPCDAASYKPGQRRRKVPRKKTYGAPVQFSNFLSIMKFIFFFTIGPLAIYFVYTVATDPDLPRILKYLWAQTKKKWLCYLGRKSDLTVEPISGGGDEYEPEEDDDDDDEPVITTTTRSYSRYKKFR